MTIDRRDFIRLGLAGSAVTITGCSATNPTSSTNQPQVTAAPNPAPVPRFELDEVSVRDLQEGMKSGKYTARSITELYLQRIDALNTKGPRLFSVLETNPD